MIEIVKELLAHCKSEDKDENFDEYWDKFG